MPASHAIEPDDGAARRMRSPPPDDPLEIFLLGEVALDDALRLQRRLVYDQGERPGGALILCEHPPSHQRRPLRQPRPHRGRRRRACAIAACSVRWVNRGGGCVLHRPGQLAAYLVLPLDAREVGPRRLPRRASTACSLDLLAEFDLAGRTATERPGVFLNHARVGVGRGRLRPLDRLSRLHPERGHRTSPRSTLLDEPGLDGWPLRQTSMEAQRQRPAPMAKVREGADPPRRVAVRP